MGSDTDMTFIPQIPNDWLKKQNQQLLESENRGGKFVGVEVQRDFEPETPVPVIYGFQRIEGPIIYLSTKYGDSNILYMVVSLGEGQCGVINRLFVDNTPVNLLNAGTTNAILTHNTITYPNSPDRLRPSGNISDILAAFEYMDGRPTQGVSNLLKEIYAPATSPSPPRYSNLAYLVCKFVYRAGVFRDLPRITVDMFGRTVTQFGTSVLNPVNQLYDYLTDTRYGAGIAAADIDNTSFQSVYTYLETNRVKQVPADTGWSILPSHLTLDTSQTVLDNVNVFLTDFGFLLNYYGGKYRLTIEGKNNSEGTITDSMIVSEITVTKPSSDDKFNSFAVDYTDVANNFVKTSAVFPISGLFTLNVFENQDNGRKRQGRVDARGIGYYWTALSHAKKLFYKSRNQDTYTFTCVKEAYRYTVGDVITLSTTIPSITNELMRIIEMKMNEDFTISITAVKHSNDWYPPFAGDTPNFGGSLNGPVLPTVMPAPSPAVSQNQPTTPTQPAPGDPGGTVIVPQAPILPASPTITMNNIVQPDVTLKTSPVGVGQSLQAWPNLRRTSTTTDSNWYLGGMLKQQLLTTSPWATKVGNYVYTIEGSNPRFLSGTRRPVGLDVEYCFGTQVLLDGHTASKVLPPASIIPTYTLKLAPMVTYRYQGEDANNMTIISDDNPQAGQYKRQSYLLFLYTMGLTTGSQSSTGQFGFQREIQGGGIEYYLGDFENSGTLQKIVPNKTPVAVPWIELVDICPRMNYVPNPNNLQGGYYGGVDINDARTHIQWIANSPALSLSQRPSLDVAWPLPANLTPTLNRSSAAKITMKIFAIPDLNAPRPEYLGFVEASTWLATANPPQGFYKNFNIQIWKTAGNTTTLPVLN